MTLSQVADAVDATLILLQTASTSDKESFLERMRRDSAGSIVLEESENGAIFICTCQARQVARHLRDRGCAFAYQLAYADGFEQYTLFARSRSDIDEAVRTFSTLGRLTIDRVTEISLSCVDVRVTLTSVAAQMSERQLGALRTAIQAGYYDRPRVMSAQDLARAAGLGRSTYLEHLRKAEETIMRTLGRTLIEHPALQAAAVKGPGRPRKAKSSPGPR